MREPPSILRFGVAASLVALAVILIALVGLILFRREYARRVAPFSAFPEVELAYGAPWLVVVKTLAFAARHPSTLRWGLVYALHLLIGVDPLAAITDAELARVHREGERRSRQ
jgi:hypothetical protein